MKKIDPAHYPIYETEMKKLMAVIEKEIEKQENVKYRYLPLSETDFQEMYRRAQAADERLVLKGYCLRRVNFRKIKCVDIDFVDCDMSHESLLYCSFLDCSFVGVDMTNIFAPNIEFSGCKFVNTDARWGVFLESRFYCCEK